MRISFARLCAVLARSYRAVSACSIATRLIIAFCAAAALAVAAIFLVEHGTLVVNTTEIRPAAQTSEIPVERLAARHTALNFAIERYVGAVLNRAREGSSQNRQRLRDADTALDRAAASYLAAADATGNEKYLSRLRASLKALRQREGRLIDHADGRGALLEAYQDDFEQLDQRMRSLLDKAPRLFGRVITARFLVDLGRNLDTMRSRLIRFATATGYTEADVRAMQANEQEFSTTLERNERGLTRSQGMEWMSEMRAGLVSLAAARVSLVTADGQRREDADAFITGGSRLTAYILREHAHLRLPAPPAMPAAEPSVQRTVVADTGHESRRLIVAISVIVLLLLFVIALGTVRSIVLPVRRLMDATRKLATGEAVHVPRGGIRELDTLGVAFNSMARELSAAQHTAREYQCTLEEQVAQRTRELQELAENDPLTQLPNRRQLFFLLNTAIARVARDGRKLGVFFLDLDNFKNVNDSMGHAYGDRLLQKIAERLRQSAQPHGFAARLGGDEFTVVCEGVGSQEIEAAGLKLVEAFHEPLSIGERELTVSVSVGASLYPDDGTSAEALLRAADVALFRAKALGRNQMTLFAAELLEEAARKFSTEQGLRQAIERDEFELVFQQEFDSQTLSVTLVEALLRWRTPDGQCVSPATFLPIAEETGLIVEIGDHVLRKAIATAASWHRGPWPEARMAINISPRQLFDCRFPGRVRALLEEFDLPAACIEFELTETVLQTGAGTIETIKALRDLGVSIALDDFGTGYSSIASLEQLPLTRVKLDRSLIASIDHSARSQAIARAIIGLCQELQLDVTAEGVEREEQLKLLRRHRAIYLQGYLMSHPLSEKDLLEVCRRRHRSVGRVIRLA